MNINDKSVLEMLNKLIAVDRLNKNQILQMVNLVSLSNDINDNSQFMLSKAYPNPFNPSTSISLTLPNTEFVSVKVYNLMGQEIEILSEGILEANIHTFTWNANNVSSGVYLIKAESNSNVSIQKVLLVK